MNQPKDIREMRQRIMQAMRGQHRVDGKEEGRATIAPASSMVRGVLHMAEHEGLSGEDAMTALAYHALIAYEDMYDRVLEFSALTPSQPIVFAETVAEAMRKRSDLG